LAENSEEEASSQDPAAPLTAQAVSAETVHIDMTLIQAVEPELLRNVMPNRLTEAEEQAFIWNCYV
jgi:hypothetical protein